MNIRIKSIIKNPSVIYILWIYIYDKIAYLNLYNLFKIKFFVLFKFLNKLLRIFIYIKKNIFYT